MIDASRVVVATTFEDVHPYAMETEILFRTLAAYGGELARARRIACSVGEPDPFVAQVLADLDVEVRVVERFDERCPHANKLAMLQLADAGDVVLALDTDIAVAGDATPWLTLDAIQAKPVDVETLSVGFWGLVFEARGIPMPRERYLTSFTAASSVPYFNSGVLAVPSAMCAELHEAWSAEIRWLLDGGYEQLPPAVSERSFFTDQFALAFALARLDLPVRALPLVCNFPTNHPIHAIHGPNDLRPLLVHHHHRLRSDGQLEPTGHTWPDAAIERVNAELRRDTDAGAEGAPGEPKAGQSAFDNERFWDERYATNPTLGSGHGSRGTVAERKRALLQAVIDAHEPASILDVGCGDLEIVRGLRTGGAAYVGIDISAVVVERNAELMPQWRFLHGEFTMLAAEQDLDAELVLCLDVLIHQHERDGYDAFVRELVRATRGIGIVAAYDREPAGDYASAITAWHEPISETLLRHGARDVQVVDEYRGTAVVRFAAGVA